MNMHVSLSKVDCKPILAFGAIYLIWGTTYLAVRIGIETLPPFLMATLRYIIAGLLLLGICAAKGESIFSREAIDNILLGAFMLSLGQAALFWAEKYISSGLTSVYSSTLPIWFLISDKRNWSKYFKSSSTLISILLGVIGVAILFAGGAGLAVHAPPGMALLASVVTVGSGFCWAIGSLWFKYHHKNGSLYLNVGWQLIGGAIACPLIGFFVEDWRKFSFTQVTTASWVAMFYLAFAGSIIALIAMYWLLARKPAPVVGTYAYVNPVIALMIGYFFGREKVTALQVLGAAVILVAAFLANSVKEKASEITKNKINAIA